MTGGAVKCWGENGDGQLGNGSLTDSYFAAVDVGGLGEPVLAIEGGMLFTCALMASGGLKCWGSGFGVTPVSVAGFESVTAFEAGGFHVCAVVTSGALKCRGDNAFGQLGDGTLTDRPSPVDVVGLASGISDLAGGTFHTCALLSGGSVKCWGFNQYGQVGDGTTANRSVPFEVVVAVPKPTPTSTPCPVSGCPTATATPTAPPQTGIDLRQWRRIRKMCDLHR
jgi:alpha-tubulin suppressor-like RCC1 family protein